MPQANVMLDVTVRGINPATGAVVDSRHFSPLAGSTIHVDNINVALNYTLDASVDHVWGGYEVRGLNFTSVIYEQLPAPPHPNLNANITVIVSSRYLPNWGYGMPEWGPAGMPVWSPSPYGAQGQQSQAQFEGCVNMGGTPQIQNGQVTCNPPPPGAAKNNTWLYVVGGVAALAVVGGLVYAASRKGGK